VGAKRFLFRRKSLGAVCAALLATALCDWKAQAKQSGQLRILSSLATPSGGRHAAGMFKSLRFSNFRAFRSLNIDGLTRLNLFVGENNAGKTSVLEGAEILMAGGLPWSLLRSPTRRLEGFLPSVERRAGRDVLDIRHLFHGHELRAGSAFSLQGDGTKARFVRCRVAVGSEESEEAAQASLSFRESTAAGLVGPVGAQGSFDPETPLMLELEGDQLGHPRNVPLGPGGTLSIPLAARRLGAEDDVDAPMNFISTTDPDYRLAALWDRVVLTPGEDRVTDALRIIEPGIERVASLSRIDGRASSSSIVLRLSGSGERVPIGSMGDGMKRLFVLSVNLVNSAGGCLFVDEIDTGLHHTVMAKMWTLLIEAATRLDVQIFATTHSLDCLQSLTRVYEAQQHFADQISVHRLRRGSENAVRYAADEMLVAVQQEMEIR
jgi:hypothetical protein